MPDAQSHHESAFIPCPRVGIIEPALAAAPTYVLRPKSCEVCSSRDNLTVCISCLVTYYCSEEHKLSDYTRHHEKCCYTGNNWLSGGDCPHYQNLHTLFKVDLTLHLFPNIAATEISLRRLLRIHNRSGVPESWKGLYVAITDLIPVMYVRQGRDAAAYNFMFHHWDKEFVYQPSRLSFTQLQGYTGLGHQVLLTLLAIKALRYIQDIENISIAFRGVNIPQEIMDIICEFPGTDFLEPISGFDFIKATGDASWRQKKIREMRRTVMKCVYEAGRTNRHIWSVMLDTESLAAREEFGQFNNQAARPRPTGWDVRELAELVAIRQYQVWMETPGSYDILKSAKEVVATRASEMGFSWPMQRIPGIIVCVGE